jgi:uncharacterized membrane protein YdfJ with MMPL/SSD domain
MDYQVFLLSRIRERYEQTGDSDEAVEWGASRCRPVATGLTFPRAFGQLTNTAD